MRALSAAELLRVWEVAGDRHPIDRALALLCAACPGWEVQQLARLPVGRRDALLLALRQRTLGPQLLGYGQCPQCATHVEFSVTIADLLQTVEGVGTGAPDRAALQPEEHMLEANEHHVRFRLPNSFDLAAIVDCADAREERNELLRYCVLDARQGQAETPISDLPDSLVTLLGDRMAELDPLAEVRLELNCPECQHRWPVTLDIASFFWNEIAGRAKRLLHDVHVLARAYAWREQDILAMSERRRQYFLNMVS